MKHPLARALPVILVAAFIGACSQVQLGYNAAGFFIKQYANDYLELTGTQQRAWQPRLARIMDTHREDVLPELAGYADAVSSAAAARFPRPQTTCLVDGFEDLYRRHARLAVSLAAPLLAGLDDAQVSALADRFARDAEDDRPDTDAGRLEREQRKRAKRYIERIEDWTGELTEKQRGAVRRVTDRMPDTTFAVYAYRGRKRAELIALLESGADESRVHRFLSDWIVEYRDLPSQLRRAGGEYGERSAELLMTLGKVLDDQQIARLVGRLGKLTRDLESLQDRPRIEPLSC